MQLEGPTQNTHGFKITQKKTGNSGAREKQTISTLSVEIFGKYSVASIQHSHTCSNAPLVRSRGDLLPNPSEDEISCLFYCFSEAGGDAEDRSDYQSGCIVLSPAEPLADRRWIPGYTIETASTELDLLNSLIDLVRDWDPDILAGWQVQTASWGYIEARCRIFG